MIDKEIKCPCGYREYMEEHNCEKIDCDKCCPLALQEIINRQQTENQKLKGHLEQLKSRYDNAKAEIERLQKENNQFADIGKMYSEIRAEAIKKYIEKLKDLSYESDLYDRNERWVKAVTVEEIDETYKEMVGENNG